MPKPAGHVTNIRCQSFSEISYVSREDAFNKATNTLNEWFQDHSKIKIIDIKWDIQLRLKKFSETKGNQHIACIEMIFTDK